MLDDLLDYEPVCDPDIAGVPQLTVVRLVDSLGIKVIVAVNVPSTVVNPPDLTIVVETVINEPVSALEPCVPLDLTLIVNELPS